VRIVRFGVLSFQGNFGRAAVAEQTLAFGDRRRFFPLTVATGAGNIPEGMQVAARHFPLQGAREAFFGKVANQASDVRHFPDVHMLFWKRFLQTVAGRAVPGLCAGHPDNFGRSGFLCLRPLGKTRLTVQQKKENHQSGKKF
jgi:hypothetical protein